MFKFCIQRLMTVVIAAYIFHNTSFGFVAPFVYKQGQHLKDITNNSTPLKIEFREKKLSPISAKVHNLNIKNDKTKQVNLNHHIEIRGNIPKLHAKDLSVILGTSLSHPIYADTTSLFETDWLKSVDLAFRETEVEDSFLLESPIEDWRLVSYRVSPCVPLVDSSYFQPNIFCWPQVRTVWQPVVNKMPLEWSNLENYSDDRAVHVLFTINPTNLTSYQESDLALFEKIKFLSSEQPNSLSKLDREEIKDFIDLRDQVAKHILIQASLLRDENISEKEFRKFGFRPELNKDHLSEGIFRKKMIDFLERYTNAKDLHELTSFSLPWGRSPAAIDTWVFLAFKSKGGKLIPKPLQVYSIENGTPIGPELSSQSVGMWSDDHAFMSSPDVKALRKQVLIHESDRENVRKKVFGKKLLLVGETSCATCHKYNSIRFNFHNASKFEERETNISSKLENEVAIDLRWIRKYLKM